MMIVALQLNDWGKTSANQTIALVTYLKENYNIEIYILMVILVVEKPCPL